MRHESLLENVLDDKLVASHRRLDRGQKALDDELQVNDDDASLHGKRRGQLLEQRPCRCAAIVVWREDLSGDVLRQLPVVRVEPDVAAHGQLDTRFDVVKPKCWQVKHVARR